VHAGQREARYQRVDPATLARRLPGLATIGGPALVATMGQASRFAAAAKFRGFTGLAPKASETGQTDRKGQPISKAGNRLLRTTLVRAADHARRQDPQLARVYWTQMVQRGKDHLGALCVVAAHLAERAWTVMDRGTPYVVCDTDGTPVTPTQAKALIAARWTVPEQVRRQRRSRKGKAPQQVLTGHAHGAPGATRRPSPSSATLGRQPSRVSRPASLAAAVGVTIGPGRSRAAARASRSAGRPRSCSRSSAGAVTSSARRALAAWLRDLTAVALATRRHRTISTSWSPLLGMAVA
jgi:transposase IS116/IS110/IS902 family protein